MNETKEEKEKIICSACLVKNKNTNNIELSSTLWGINPYAYSTHKDLKNALSIFIDTHYTQQGNPSYFYNALNNDGYTFSQWNIYYLSKNDTKSRRLHLQTMWLFYILSEYPFFSDMIRCGKRDDPLHHTLHHFASYLEKYGHSQKKITSLLTSHGLSLLDIDSEGNTPSSFLLQIEMDKEDVIRCNQLTHSYKHLEKVCLSPLYAYNHIRKCEECNEAVGLFEDITTHFEKIKHLSNDIEEMIKLREECNDIYKKYGDTSCVQRHQYVVDLYKSLLYN